MPDAIQPGDVVTLKSGSEPMVVEAIFSINGRETAQCVWQNQAGDHQMKNYAPVALRKGGG